VAAGDSGMHVMYVHHITAPSACANITFFRYNTAAGTPVPSLQLLVSILLVDYAVPHINLVLCLGKQQYCKAQL
jgi:hypothetical protein